VRRPQRTDRCAAFRLGAGAAKRCCWCSLHRLLLLPLLLLPLLLLPLLLPGTVLLLPPPHHPPQLTIYALLGNVAAKLKIGQPSCLGFTYAKGLVPRSGYSGFWSPEGLLRVPRHKAAGS
jgi:hypothetical protein